MKQVTGILGFILSTIVRTFPFILFCIAHLFWGVYSYRLDPISLLALKGIPEALGSPFWLYLAMGVLILIFLSLDLKILAYLAFLGCFIGQNYFFFREWQRSVAGDNQPQATGAWFALTALGLLLGFIIQVLYTDGRAYRKLKLYNRLRNSD